MMETWSGSDTAGWTNGSSDVTIMNRDCHLDAEFHAQAVPSPGSDIFGIEIDPDIMVTNISFRFIAADSSPSSLRLYLHSAENDNEWYVNLPSPAAGEWTTFTVPVVYSAGWIMGPNNTEDQFLNDIESINWVGVYVMRYGDVAAQNYGIDDFRVQGYKPSQIVDGAPDEDQDGIPDEWEERYGLNAGNAQDAILDSDGDGMSSYAEYVAGTNPGDALSRFKIEMCTANTKDGSVKSSMKE